MAKKTKKVAQSKAEQNADQLLSRTDRFLDKYMKQLIIGVAVIIILVLGVIGFRHFYLVPQEQKAVDAIFVAERYFGQQEWDAALNGDSIGSVGFLEIIDDFGSTNTGNLAKAYAGVCHYRLGQYEDAISYLKKYKQKDKVLGATFTGLIGDSYANLNNASEAIKYFKKAADEAKNDVLSPMYLKKVAIAYESLGQYQDALDAFTQIEDKYPASVEGRTIEKDILRAKGLLK